MGLAYFHGRMLQRGTSRHTFQELNKITDSIGASLRASAGERGLVVSIKCLREDLDLLADLAADLILRPTFPKSEIDKVRGEVLTSLRELRNDTRSVASRAFYPTIYGDGHPYSRWQMGTEETVNSFARSDLVDFHQSSVGPAGATVIAAGDISLDRLSRLLDSMFAGWESSRSAPDKWDVPPASPPADPIRRHLIVEGKTQTDIIVGLPVISRRDPDFYALNMADLVLGGLGLMGRLGANVRDEQGLAYYVYSSLGVSHGPGAWTVRAGVNPANVDRAIESIRHEIEVLTNDKVEPEELADGKSYVTGALPLSTETNNGVAAILNHIESCDLGLDYLDRFPDIVNSLTDDEVLEAARRHLVPEKMVIVTAGPPEVSPEQ
jgi:zinc protease